MPVRYRLIPPVVLIALAVGCAATPPPIANPIMVTGRQPESVWEHAIDVLHGFHFPIKTESRTIVGDRLNGVIETGYLPGAGIAEPWHRDSVNLAEKLESSLQPIRRRVSVIFKDNGTLSIEVQVIKEREDPKDPSRYAPGIATFPESRPQPQDLSLVEEHVTPTGWIPLGRDRVLERAILAELQQRVGY